MTHLRVIDDGPRSGVVNMTRDAELLARHDPEAAPILRLYRWSPPAVSLGYNQQPEDFDPERIAALGFDLVRRPTGGRAILHAQELTYAVIGASPSPLFGDSLHSTYQRINLALLAFLDGLGLAAEVSAGESRDQVTGPVCFQSAGQHEVKVGGRKLIGSAQRRAGGVFLQHGSILTGPAHQRLLECLGEDRNGATSAAEEGLAKVATDLGELLGRDLRGDDHDDLARRLAQAFAVCFACEAVAYRPDF